MRKSACLPLLLLASASLAACHTDPFSIKPEVPNVQLPEKPEPSEGTAGDQQDPAEAEKVPDSF